MDGSERLAAQSFHLERRPHVAAGNRRRQHELGCAYWAVTDHSKSSFQANGLDAARLRQQLEEVGRPQPRNSPAKGSDFRFLTGSEVDILTDGRLDFDGRPAGATGRGGGERASGLHPERSGDDPALDPRGAKIPSFTSWAI